MPHIYGAWLVGKYYVSELHFHWGSKEVGGSEHMINGKRLDVELHIVHKLQDLNAGAEQNSSGIAVVGILFEISRVSYSLLIFNIVIQFCN